MSGDRVIIFIIIFKYIFTGGILMGIGTISFDDDKFSLSRPAGGKADPPGSSQALAKEFLDSILVELRVIDAVFASTEFKLYGETFKTPVMTAALSNMKAPQGSGMVELAKGAAASGAVMWAGIGDEAELEAIAGTGAKTIKIIKPYADADLIYEKIAQAEKHGAIAVGMDIDFFFGGKRKRLYAMDYKVGPKTLDEIKGFIRATKLPFILKGVLSETDAHKALEAGAGGIVVSHHSGSVIDSALPPIALLPRIKKIVAGRIPIFIDGSFTSGIDVFKAIALGADAVSIGKPLVEAVASEGANGAEKLIDSLTEDLKYAMSLTGAGCLDTIDPGVLWR
jgi:isopentenyl diphosphate isomerase/L-lactate dehydrogenase-like FMN-dependent dehydrogenase